MTEILLGFFIATTLGLLIAIRLYLKEQTRKMQLIESPKLRMLVKVNRLLYEDLYIITSEDARYTEQEKKHISDKYRHFKQKEEKEREMWYSQLQNIK